MSNKDSYVHVNNKFIHGSLKLKITQVNINRCVDKQMRYSQSLHVCTVCEDFIVLFLLRLIRILG